MSKILYSAAHRLFTLQAGKSTYVMRIADCGALEHIYYGATLTGLEECVYGEEERGFFQNERPKWNGGESPAGLCAEYTSNGIGDQGVTSGAIRTADGHILAVPLYQNHRIFAGKPELAGLPSSYANESECQTLEITLLDAPTAIEYTLSYTVFENSSVIARSLKVANRGTTEAVIERLYSATLEMPSTVEGYDLISFPGAWGRERQPDRQRITRGARVLRSTRGTTSPIMNPSFILANPATTETAGDCLGEVLIYTGSWQAEIDQLDAGAIRTVLGISPENFRWRLAPGAQFQAPEVLLMWSSQGLEGLTHTSHDFFRNHILRGPWKDIERPILINNWEATYFNFDEAKLLSLAKTAKSLGIEMLVLDDGWFGHRDADNSSLGDWFVDRKKLPDGIDGLSRKLHEIGMKFGLWFEPEMISEDSELYRKHPDYCLHVEGRTRSTVRTQLVLDMSRKEVVDNVFEQLCKMFDSAQIDYMKWDCNRMISEAGSAALPPERQGEVLHRYVLGLYDLLGRIRNRYPNLLIEGCAGGGGRFDAGLLCYTPQIWCSDDTDGSARLFIQYGTSFFYPCSTMGAHVADCPNHLLKRTTPFASRGLIALSGTFGYELDLEQISEEDRNQIPGQVRLFHDVHHLVTSGDYYRLLPPTHDKFCAWAFVSKDKSECLAFAATVRALAFPPQYTVRFRGLDPEALYQDGNGHAYSGSMLMNMGLKIDAQAPDCTVVHWHLRKAVR